MDPVDPDPQHWLKLNNTQRFHVDVDPDFIYSDVDLDPTLKLDKYDVHNRTAETLKKPDVFGPLGSGSV